MQAILEFFKNFSDSISTDLQFVIDDISAEDSSAVGVTWHLGTVKCNVILTSIQTSAFLQNSYQKLYNIYVTVEYLFLF